MYRVSHGAQAFALRCCLFTAGGVLTALMTTGYAPLLLNRSDSIQRSNVIGVSPLQHGHIGLLPKNSSKRMSFDHHWTR